MKRNRAVALLSMLFCCAAMADTVVGVHIGTYHLDRDGGANDFNPGAYLQVDGVIGGLYYNSRRKNSFYGGYTYRWGSGFQPAVTLGAVTGYDTLLRPVLLASVRVGHVRFAFIPPVAGISGGIHVSTEF
jgi:hypothetical protein